MRKRSILLLAAMMLASLLVSAPAFAEGDEAQLTLVHGIPGAAVDVYVDGVNTLENFEPNTVTPPIPLAAATYQVDIYLPGEGPAPADKPDAVHDPILSAALTLAAGDNVSAVAHLTADGDFAPTAFANDTGEIDEGDARLVVRHLAAAPAVDIIANGSLALFENVTNPNEGQVDVPADTYGVTINPAGSDTIAFDAGDATLPESQSTIVYAIGDLAEETFGLLVQAIPNLGPEGWFTDDEDSVHQANIDLIALLGTTRGTGEGTFSPDDEVTRGQMAAFLRRALGLPESAVDYFDDDEASIFESNINAIAAAGITLGTGVDTYSADDEVTRGQMAASLQGAFNVPNSGTDAFGDDDNSIFESNINAIAAAGITVGTGPDAYSPEASVSRAQMATFLARALGIGS